MFKMNGHNDGDSTATEYNVLAANQFKYDYEQLSNMIRSVMLDVFQDVFPRKALQKMKKPSFWKQLN